MDLIFPFIEPIETARLLKPVLLRKQVSALKRMNASDPDYEWYSRMLICYEKYLAGNMEQAGWWSCHETLVTPKWLTKDKCDEYLNELKANHPKLYGNPEPRAAKEA